MAYPRDGVVGLPPRGQSAYQGDPGYALARAGPGDGLGALYTSPLPGLAPDTEPAVVLAPRITPSPYTPGFEMPPDGELAIEDEEFGALMLAECPGAEPEEAVLGGLAQSAQSVLGGLGY